MYLQQKESKRCVYNNQPWEQQKRFGKFLEELYSNGERNFKFDCYIKWINYDIFDVGINLSVLIVTKPYK